MSTIETHDNQTLTKVDAGTNLQQEYKRDNITQAEPPFTLQEAGLCATSFVNEVPIPQTIKEAMAMNEHAEHWNKSCEKELDSMRKLKLY